MAAESPYSTRSFSTHNIKSVCSILAWCSVDVVLFVCFGLFVVCLFCFCLFFNLSMKFFFFYEPLVYSIKRFL